METNIHWPTDNTLLWDAVRVITRLVTRLGEHVPSARSGFANRTLRARRRVQEISHLTPAQCSALCARCVRPSFIFVILASGSDGFPQSVFDVRFFRRRSRRAKAARVGVLIPDAAAGRVRNSW